MHVQTAEARLSLLDAPQRAAITAVLRHLAEAWRMKDAEEILRDWRSG